ncbi:MAG: hypothetical protein WC531_03445 [Candidatus Paceibacterota bacterium]|jgi:hypothetical protein
MINSQRKKVYLILIFNLLLLTAIGLLVWQIIEEKKELSQSLATTSLVKSADGELMSGSWPKLQAQLMLIDENFLSASTTVGLLERLEATAKQTKTSFKINNVDAQDDLRLNFSVQGSYSAVNQFLALLEKFPYALRLERFDARADQGNWRGDFVVTFITLK